MNKAVKGVFWSGIERFSTQIVQFIISVILARLLLPADFGIVAITLIIMNVLQVINETGFGAALMQKLDRDELDFSTVFVFNIFLSLVLYGLLYLSAPFIAAFFEQPILTDLTRILGLNLIISSFIVVQRARLFIKVDFKTQAKAAFIAIVISGGVGIYCAYVGMGVMALIIQSLLNNGINTLLLWIFVKWQPKLQFSYSRFTGLFKYAYKLVLAQLINRVFQEMYSLVIGKVYSPAQLGYFNRAKSFEQLSANNIYTIVGRVSTPLLCEVQKDNDKMGQVLLKFIQNTAFIVYPLLFGMFVLAEPLIRVLLTDKWLPAVWILKVLCPIGLFYVISTFNRNVFNATGRTDWALESEIIKKCIFVAILAIAIYFGFKALVYSQILIAIIEFFIDTFYTKKQIGLTLLKQIKSVVAIFLAALSMAFFVWFVTLFLVNDIYKLIIGSIIGIFVYSIVCYMCNVSSFREKFQLIIAKINHGKKNNY
ncbi:MAG: lipopolysaccharide biosynthesis protein [Dysgonamonadaceae bacterium]|jgi:O-antigen/teichoic acid export membrane protein|nr:lipopolysaccharide biosynthesis protein [Dysgonamonadaceae bacterium]